MYSRSYYPDSNERLSIPENYDGTALIESTQHNSEELTVDSANISDTAEESVSAAQNLGKIPILSSLFANSGLNFGLKMPKIGVEEILIIATAAFLFFSKDGDRECAIMLALLLLIN